MNLPTPKSIQQHIETNIKCEFISLEGDGQHFFATIVSSIFENKTRIQRHQLVYTALGERMKEEIHALSMKTFTPYEYKNIK
jgi:acid stress-induced BolA-like protein IbaG/YrbA